MGALGASLRYAYAVVPAAISCFFGAIQSSWIALATYATGASGATIAASTAPPSLASGATASASAHTSSGSICLVR